MCDSCPDWEPTPEELADIEYERWKDEMACNWGEWSDRTERYMNELLEAITAEQPKPPYPDELSQLESYLKQQFPLTFEDTREEERERLAEKTMKGFADRKQLTE